MFLYLVVLSIVTYSIGHYLFHKIRNLPPTPFPILPVIGHLHRLKRPLHHCLRRLAAIHGPVMILHFGSRRVLVVSSPSAAEECLTKNDIVFANRPRLLFGKYLGNNYTTLAWSPHGENWRNLRKMVSVEILSADRLQKLMSSRADEVRLLVRRLAMQCHAAVEGHVVVKDMNSVFFDLTLNLLMRMIGGKILFCGENLKKFHEMVKELVKLLGTTNIGDFLPLVGKIGFNSIGKKKLQRLQVKRDKLMQSLVDGIKSIVDDDEGKKKKKKKDMSMIQILLCRQKTDPDGYSDVTITNLMSLLIAAGTETTLYTLEWAMALLLNHPEILKKAQVEMDTMVGFDRLVTELDLVNLPYLHCIIAETLRMYPPGPLGIPHESSDDCVVGGYRVPKGTTLLLNLYAIHRDPSYWSDANKFKPERFEGTELEVKFSYKWLPFGAGRRSCPGENLAFKMVGLTLGALIQCFEWDRVSHELVDMTEGLGLTMAKVKPLKAQCRPRRDIEPFLFQTDAISTSNNF